MRLPPAPGFVLPKSGPAPVTPVVRAFANRRLLAIFLCFAVVVAALAPAGRAPFAAPAAEAAPAAQTATGRSYVLSWYDAIGTNGSDWVLVANPGPAAVNAQISVAGAVRWSGTIQPGERVTPQFFGLRGGPVVVQGNLDQPLLVSQRLLWNGQLREVTGVPMTDLSAHYYFGWYDAVGTDGLAWILVANPSASPVGARITLKGTQLWSGTIPAGGIVTPQFMGQQGGPVEVFGFDPANAASPRTVFASHRTLWFGGTAFHEEVGTPAESLGANAMFPWYDAVGTNGQDWVLVANPNAAPIRVAITVAGAPAWSGTVEANAVTMPSFAGVMGGPVVVTATDAANPATARPVLASQRAFWGRSFSAVAGRPAEQLGSEAYFTWYDSVNSNGSDWILIGNPGSRAITASVTIGKVSRGAYTVQPGASVTPKWAGVMDGPVTVSAVDAATGAPANLFASQRVLWGGALDEVWGLQNLRGRAGQTLPAATSTPVSPVIPTATATATRTPTAPVVSATATATTTAVKTATPVAAVPNSGVTFSVYPGGNTGESSQATPPDPSLVLQKLQTLRGAKPFNVHLYLSWKDSVESWFWTYYDQEVQRYTAANPAFTVSLTVRYYPPAGREGDVTGYVAFVKSVAQRYAANPRVTHYVVGNEANVTWGYVSASDGPVAGADQAVAQGVVAVRQALDAANSTALAGFNLATTGRDQDAAFVQRLIQAGGAQFKPSVGFMGVDVYPGIWPQGTGNAYSDMATFLADARYALTAAGLPATVKLEVLENGAPLLSETDQSQRLGEFVRAVCDNRSALNITGYSWFALWDANSSNTSSVFNHYGLLRSDLTPKASFDTYRNGMALPGCAAQ